MQGAQEQEPEKGGMPTGEMGASGPESRMTASATSAMSPLDQPSTHEMPSRGAAVGNGSAHPDANGTLAEMPGGGMAAEFEEHGSERVLVELRVPARAGAAEALQMAGDVRIQGFELDAAYDPVPVSGHADAGASPAAADEQVVIVRGTVQPDKRAELEAQPNVIKVWDDTPIAPFVAPRVRGGADRDRRCDRCRGAARRRSDGRLRDLSDRDVRLLARDGEGRDGRRRRVSGRRSDLGRRDPRLRDRRGRRGRRASPRSGAR